MKLNLAVLSARRTPVGTFLGSLKSMSPTELGVLAGEAAIKDSNISPNDFVQSIFGNVCSASAPDTAYLPRHIALRLGLPTGSGAFAVNRMCGSGFEALVQGSFYANEGPCLVGGAESMSLTPLLLREAREGFRFSQPPQAIDSLWEALTDRYAQMSMGQTAENLATEFKISREECDLWAFNSHQRAAKATESGAFSKEIVPVSLPKDQKMEKDEHIRFDSSLEKLAKLRPVFGGVTTAGNASGMNDAAAALVVSSVDWAKSKSLKPMAKVVGAQSVGCDPKRMGIGPVDAVKKLMAELSWKWDEVDYIEINEAFAAQILAVQKSLGITPEKLNPHGSGISLGHPLGATGARISTHIVHLIQSGQVKRAIGGACIGGGQGIALAFEAW
jgi:acetyl-CoA acetyltransferase family protein